MPHRPLRYENYSRSGKYRLRKLRRENSPVTHNNIEEDNPSMNITESANNVSEIYYDAIDGNSAENFSDTQLADITDNHHTAENDTFMGDQQRDSDNDDNEVADIIENHTIENEEFIEDQKEDSNDDDNTSISSRESNNSIDSDIESEEEIETCHQNEKEKAPKDGELFCNAPITYVGSLLAILTYALTYKLSAAALGDLLHLIEIHCPKPNLCAKSMFKFKKLFSSLKAPLLYQFYCLNCSEKLPTSDALCSQCTVETKATYFIQISILEQVRTLFMRPQFSEKLQYRFIRQKKNVNNYEDIYDGAVYKELDREFLEIHNNISFTWNTDGVPLFKSSKFNIWPLYFQINELPYKERIKKENVILGGLWFGSSKPEPNLFLTSFVDELSQLYKGIQCKTPHGESVLVRGITLCGTCDLPAKALFLNCIQFNGKYGCSKCKTEGYREGRTQVYPYEYNMNLRTDVETEKFAKEAYEKNETVFGVKGPSALSLFVKEKIRTTTIDIMHCVFLGVVKKLMTLWFSTKFHNHTASLTKIVSIIDQRLQSIRPPSFVKRYNQKIVDFQHWKASEFKVWLFYYSLPILRGIMQTEYFNHHQLLVFGIYLLCEDSVSEEMIDIASSCLHEYVARFEDLYGIEHMTINIHQLIHLPQTVVDLGPLWATSCFPFENLNGELKKLVHGTRYAELQICTTASLFLNLENFKSQSLSEGQAAYDFCKKLEKRNERRKLLRISEHIAIIGQCNKSENLPLFIRDILLSNGIVGNNFYLFYKLWQRNVLYVAESYNRKGLTRSSCVTYDHNTDLKIGIIQSFVKVNSCNCDNSCECPAVLYAIVHKCHSKNEFQYTFRSATLYFLHTVNVTDEAVLVRTDQLVEVCFFISIGEHSYIIKPVNKTEVE